MAYAGARFVESLLQASVLKKTGITECTYISTNVHPECEYFSTVVLLGPNGVETAFPLPKLNDHEQKLLAACVAELKPSIEKGKAAAAPAAS
jgi:malate dehydrogenase